MARTARQGNVLAIRPGFPIPAQREEDRECIMTAKLVADGAASAHRLAQTHPNTERHRLCEAMARQDYKLPRNNLRLLVTPPAPNEEWFMMAWRDYTVAQGAYALSEAQYMRAWHLDQWDQGQRAQALDAHRNAARKALDIATADMLRMPSTKKWHISQKQRAVGKREWAEEYRPEWQAIIDEDAARFAPKSRRNAKEGC